jgi:hypothetical protein
LTDSLHKGVFVIQGRSGGTQAIYSAYGNSIDVEYRTRTLTGSSLVYHDDQLERSFANEELTVEDTLLGCAQWEFPEPD